MRLCAKRTREMDEKPIKTHIFSVLGGLGRTDCCFGRSEVSARGRRPRVNRDTCRAAVGAERDTWQRGIGQSCGRGRRGASSRTAATWRAMIGLHPPTPSADEWRTLDARSGIQALLGWLLRVWTRTYYFGRPKVLVQAVFWLEILVAIKGALFFFHF